MKKFLTVREAAEVLHVKAGEVRIYCAEGRLKASKPGRTWLIAEDDLYAYIEAHSNQAAS